MKRLMTMLSATAVAAFAVGAANGDTLDTGTGFETAAYTAGNGLDLEKVDNGDGAQLGTVVWAASDDITGTAVVSNWNGETIPASYDKARGDNYLKLDSAPLISRYAQAGGTAVEIGNGLYIDTLVQFTAGDSGPTPDGEGDKLCIWLRDDKEAGVSENETFTIMVTAGFVEDDSGNVVATNYATSTTIDNNSWHRLQVKVLAAIDSDDPADPTGILGDGFVVFIDGTAVATTTCPIDANWVSEYTLNPRAAEYFKTEAYAIFPSMVKSGGTITSLSFQGTGAIDNIAFTNGDDIDPIVIAESDMPKAKTGLTETGAEQYGIEGPLEDEAYTIGGTYKATVAGTYTAVATLLPGYVWSDRTFGATNIVWEISSSGGGSGFDGGDGSSFSIDAETQTALEAVLPAGKKLTDTADAASGMTYAQAYALGLLNEETGDVEELEATIEFVNGKVKVSLNDATATAKYVVTLKVYEKSSLTAAWPVEATQTYQLGSSAAAAGFTPGSATAGFYKVEVSIGDGTSN